MKVSVESEGAVEYERRTAMIETSQLKNSVSNPKHRTASAKRVNWIVMYQTFWITESKSALKTWGRRMRLFGVAHTVAPCALFFVVVVAWRVTSSSFLFLISYCSVASCPCILIALSCLWTRFRVVSFYFVWCCTCRQIAVRYLLFFSVIVVCSPFLQCSFVADGSECKWVPKVLI